MQKKWLYLGKGKDILVNNTHTFGTDAVLLSYFAKPKKHEKVLDIGTGCGIIPFLWLRDMPLDCSAVEIQQEAYLLAKETAEKNGFNINLFNEDINNYENFLEKASFNLISCNPPYFSKNDGIITNSHDRALQRHDFALTIEDLAKVSSKLLIFGGRLCFCLRPERLFEAATALKKYNLAIKRLRFVCKNKDSAPKLCLIEAKYGAKEGVLVLPNLILYENNKDSEEIELIYKEIRNNYKKC